MFLDPIKRQSALAVPCRTLMMVPKSSSSSVDVSHNSLMEVLGSQRKKERKLFCGWDKGLMETLVGGELIFFFFGVRNVPLRR